MKKIICLVGLLLTGCDMPKQPQSDPVLRHQYFLECLQQMSQYHGTDATQYKYLGDVVENCNSAAYGMSFPEES